MLAVVGQSWKTFSDPRQVVHLKTVLPQCGFFCMKQAHCSRIYFLEYTCPQLFLLSYKLCCAAFEAGLEHALHSGHALLTLCYFEISCMPVSDVGAGDITFILGDTTRGAEIRTNLNMSRRLFRWPLGDGVVSVDSV